MKKLLSTATFLMIILNFNACSSWFSIGDQLTYCQIHGCNYVDVGVCATPIEILHNKDDLSELRARTEKKD